MGFLKFIILFMHTLLGLVYKANKNVLKTFLERKKSTLGRCTVLGSFSREKVS